MGKVAAKRGGLNPPTIARGHPSPDDSLFLSWGQRPFAVLDLDGSEGWESRSSAAACRLDVCHKAIEKGKWLLLPVKLSS
jgi:hypothetical protein